MPVSKVHKKRKETLKKRKAKFESLIAKRVKAFNALPEADQIALLAQWKQPSTEEAVDSELG